MRGFAHGTVSRRCDHQREWSPETRVVCEGPPVVHKNETWGYSNHLGRLRQNIVSEEELGYRQLIKDL
jgi:hypothetical protein